MYSPMLTQYCMYTFAITFVIPCVHAAYAHPAFGNSASFLLVMRAYPQASWTKCEHSLPPAQICMHLHICSPAQRC